MALPAILDIRDDLRRAREATDEGGLDEEIEMVLDRLDAFENRDLAEREGIVDEIDNQLLRVEEQLDDEDAARAVQSARNRLHIYRRTREATDPNLAVVNSSARLHESEDLLSADEVTLTVTVANTGEDTEAVPTVAFYDEGGDEVESVRGPEFVLPGGDQTQLELDVDVPGDATSYAVSVADTGNVREL